MSMLSVDSLSKKFVRRRGFTSLLTFRPEKCVVALDRISFNCEPGQILGVLGPNGAGKTTLTKLIANLLLPDEGKIWIANEEMTERRHDLRRHIGYINCDERSFFWRLTGRQNLLFFLSLYERRDTGLMLSLAQRFDLEDRLDTPFERYSTGMRKKLAIIRGLMCQPTIVLFDEATNGLDPLSVIKLREVLHEICTDKVILWTTHRLEEINEICTHVLAITHGNLIFHDSVGHLKERYQMSAGKVSITIKGNVEKVCLRARQLFKPEQEMRHDSCFSFTLPSNDRSLYPQVLRLLSETQSQLVCYQQSDTPIGDIYRSLIEE